MTDGANGPANVDLSTLRTTLETFIVNRLSQHKTRIQFPAVWARLASTFVDPGDSSMSKRQVMQMAFNGVDNSQVAEIAANYVKEFCAAGKERFDLQELMGG
jgi:hypothetical protein